jgi:hypothetical protein
VFCDDPLWLDGGKTYWVSLVGLTDNQGTDISYWVTDPHAAPMIGSVPEVATATAGPSWGPWAPGELGCCGCVNMVYTLQGESCPIIWDNGPPDLGPGRGGSLSMNFTAGVRARTADDFVTTTCADQQICYIDAWIWSNCTPPDGFLELYESTCAPATATLRGGTSPGTLVANLTPVHTTPIGQQATIDGRVLDGYHLQFYGPTMPSLLKGRTYWISAGGAQQGSASNRAYFANSAICGSACPIKLTPGVTRMFITGLEPWTLTTRDYAFRIAVKGPLIFNGTATVGAHTCNLDINNDGSVDVQDIFDFMNTWLAGCP